MGRPHDSQSFEKTPIPDSANQPEVCRDKNALRPNADLLVFEMGLSHSSGVQLESGEFEPYFDALVLNYLSS